MGKGNFLGEFEQIVLLAVARLGEDGYGVTIRKEIERRAGREVTVGAVYATLARLEEKRLVASRDGAAKPERGGRARRHFQIRPAGVEALQASRDMMDRMWDGVDFGGEGA